MKPDLRSPTDPTLDERVARFVTDEGAIREAVRAFLVGQERALGEVTTVLLSGGHALVEGVPGTGKTLLVKAVAAATGLEFRRVQFTPDLLPADILGCDTLVLGDGGRERIEFRAGPVFTQFLLADEINRGTPRTQSALLEAMQEKGVTVGGSRYPLSELFTLFATRNPIEMEGTYPLPEAQLDRFQFEIRLHPATVEEMVEIAERTTQVETPRVEGVVTPERLLEMRREVRQVVCGQPVLEYAAQLVEASQPQGTRAPTLVRETVRFGAGVRAVQALVLAGKVEALRQQRFHLARQDLEAFLEPALRHRVVPSLEGEARGIGIEEVVEAVRKAVSRG